MEKQSTNGREKSTVSNTQPQLSQGMDPYQIQMPGTNTSQKITIEELEDQLAQLVKEIKRLQRKTGKFAANKAALMKYIEDEDKSRNELIEKQKISDIHHSLSLEQTAALREELVDLEASEHMLQEFHNDVIMKQDEELERLKEQLNNQSVNVEIDFAKQLRLMDEKVVQAQTKYRQAKDQVIIMTKTLDEKNIKQEELDKTIAENRQKYDEEKGKLLEIGKDIDAKLDLEKKEKSKLIAKRNKYSIKSEKLLTEYQALQAKSAERNKQLGDSKSGFQELKERIENLNSELRELRSKQLATISQKDSELADVRKQLQDSSSAYTARINKLSEINSNNEKLGDTVEKASQRNEKSKAELVNKNDEMTELSKVLNSAKKRNEELSTEKQRLDEELNARRKEFAQTQADLETYDATQDESGKRELELRAELAIAKQKLQDKINDKAKLRSEISNAAARSASEVEELKSDIERRNKQAAEYRKIKENLRREEERRASENDRKLQEFTYLSTCCQRAGHEKLIKEKTIRIDLLGNQIQAEKLRHKQENVSKIETEKKEKEKREAQVSEMKSKIENRNKEISETKELVEDLKKILKRAQTTEAESTVVHEALDSSELLGIMFSRNQSIPTASTPEYSPQQSRRVSLEFEDLSDISSIDGMDVLERARRNYAEYLQSKTDSAKLGQQDKMGH